MYVHVCKPVFKPKIELTSDERSEQQNKTERRILMELLYCRASRNEIMVKYILLNEH